MPSTTSRAQFGPFDLDSAEHRLVRDGIEIPLQPKTFELLCILVENAGRLIKKEELLQQLWPDAIVEENNLNKNVSLLRKALGEPATGQSYIETVPRLGYRFVAPVTKVDASATKIEAPVTEISPPVTGGDSSEAKIEPQPAISPEKRRAEERNSRLPLLRRPTVALGIALAVAALFAGYLGWRASNHHAASGRAMLAVLPFKNLSGDLHEDYFADGLTEEMIAQLGQLQPARLGVIARSSTVRYKNTNLTAAQLGQDLGVGYLLEGSVRRSGERVRITAQLVQAAEQTHLWAETYERPVTDVLSIQREIAEKITRSLSMQLLPAATASPHVNLESHDKYLLGLHELGKGTRESGNKAIQYFQEGIAKDPKDAHLYAALAQAYWSVTTYYRSPTETMPLAKKAALQALELDPSLANPHVTLGDVHLFFDWDWPAAAAEYRRALDINPSLPEAQLGYANYLATLGHVDEALSGVQQAYLYDPLALESRNEALWIYYFSGRMPETAEQAKKTIDLEPSAGLPYAILALASAQMGQREETLRAAENAVQFASSPSVISTTASALARIGESRKAKSLLDKALGQSEERYVCRFLVAATYVELGEKEQAVASLEQAFAQRSA